MKNTDIKYMHGSPRQGETAVTMRDFLAYELNIANPASATDEWIQLEDRVRAKRGGFE